MPALGFLFCFDIWWGLARPAKIAGGLWFAVGLAYLLYQTRGFQLRPRDHRLQRVIIKGCSANQH